MTAPYPTALAFTLDNRLQINWSDQSQRTYGFRELRDACPCATCREKRDAPQEQVTPTMNLPLLSTAEIAPMRVVAMQPVGNYAYSIAFSDGHDTGIYTFERLRELGTEAAGKPA